LMKRSNEARDRVNNFSSVLRDATRKGLLVISPAQRQSKILPPRRPTRIRLRRR
jgi:hypothetical protein